MPQYCIVKHRIENVTIDGADPDRNPDRIPATGTITLEPILQKGDSVTITENGKTTTLTLSPIEASITQGEIWHKGEPGIKIFAGGDDTNPDRIRYKATFSNMQAGGKKIELKPILFEAIPGGELELSVAQPIPGAPYPGYSASIEQALGRISTELSRTLDHIDATAANVISNVRQQNSLPRIEALESMNGVSPESPVDGQQASLISQPGTLTRAALDQSFVQAPIDLTGRGVSHLATASHNTDAIIQAISEAVGTGRQILLPATPPGKWIDVNQPLVIPDPGLLSITGHGIDRTNIRQGLRMAPLWDVQGSDVKLSGFTGMQYTSNPTKAERDDWWRDDPGTARLAIVRAQGDRISVDEVCGINANAVVNFAAWQSPLDAPRSELLDCSATNIESRMCVFGIYVAGVERFRFDNIHGSYALLPGYATPPHLVYFMERKGANRDVQGGTIRAVDGGYSYAVQLKGIENGQIRSISARRCVGVLNLMGNEDLTIDEMSSHEDMYADANYASLLMQGENHRTKIRNVDIRMASGGKPVRIVTGQTDTEIENLSVSANHTELPPEGANGFDIDIDGTRTTVKNVSVENRGQVEWEASIAIFRGEGNRIIRPTTSGAIYGVLVRFSAIDTELEDYTPSEIQASGRKIRIDGQTTLRPRPHIGTPAPPRGILLMDDGSTSSGNYSGLRWPQYGPEWEHQLGTWISDGGLIRTSSTHQHSSCVVELGTPDVVVEADVIFQIRESLTVRSPDWTNLLALRLTKVGGDAIELFAMRGGNPEALVSVPMPVTVGGQYRLKLIALGDQLTGFVDGVKMVEHTLSPEDMALFTATRHGLYSHGGAAGGHRNVTITDARV